MPEAAAVAMAPAVDSVALWLTMTVEHDLEARRAFPQLRRQQAHKLQGVASLHYVGPTEAAALLVDARARVESVSQGMRRAYRAHIKNLEAAIQEAAERVTTYAAPAAVCTERTRFAEQWRGTKEQLRALGLSVDGPWPGEPGGRRRAHGADGRGYRATIRPHSAAWTGVYLVTLEAPADVRAGELRDLEARKRRAKDAELLLARVPGSPTVFRDWMLAFVDCAQSFICQAGCKSQEHGYTIDKGVADQLRRDLDGVKAVLRGTHINFDTVRHATIVQQHRTAIAAADDGFQAQLETMLKGSGSELDDVADDKGKH